ncbi:MAG TPA: hypothetical protein VF692_14535 [Pyrinomonadaceae bacterium]
MQDTSNMPNPDVNSPSVGDDSESTNLERENEELPTPPDRAPNAPIEEPPEIDRPAIDEDGDTEPQRIV